MDNTRQTGMNSSSMIDLKAELYRKQEQLKKGSSSKNGDAFIKGRIQEKKKTDIFSFKNKGVLERSQKDYEARVEEENVLDKSRKALEAKAKLYDKIASSSEIPDEDGSGLYLVDFQKKVIDNIVEERRKGDEESKGQQAMSDEELEDIPEVSDPQLQWVDYVDTLGRSRSCMRKDLPEVEKQDKEMAEVRGEATRTSDIEAAPDLMSADMHREMLRQKWEKEEEEALNKSNIHYSNVQFDEIRTHGVGFYQFDKDEEKRKEQLDSLQELRKKTLNERSKQDRLKEKRKAMLDARLAKVKQRRLQKAGISLTELQEKEIDHKINNLLNSKSQETEESEKKEIEPLVREPSLRHDAPEREWDKGKERERPSVFSAQKYVSDRRDERLAEFGPPTIYYDTPRSKVIAPHPDTVIIPRENLTRVKTTVTAENISDIPLPPSLRQEDLGKAKFEPNLSLQTCAPITLPDVSRPPPTFSWGRVGPPPPMYNQYIHTDPHMHMFNPPQATSSIPMSSSLSKTYTQNPGTSSISSSQSISPEAIYPVYSNFNVSASQTTTDTVNELPTVHIPRSSIIDMRFVKNENSDLSMPLDYTDSESKKYEPGSFTAALQAESDAVDEIAAVSRQMTSFRGGPVMYNRCQQSLDSLENDKKTEDQVATFLKEMRETKQ